MISKKQMRVENVWMLTREYGNLAGAGGVKDMVRQLSASLADSGRKTHVVLPCYGFMEPRAHGFQPTEIIFDVDMNYADRERRESVQIWKKVGQPTIYLADSRRFREKMGVYTYTIEEEKKNPDHRYGQGHFDYFAMNVLLQKTALALMVHQNQQPNIIHCHDGHTAILPALIREQEGYRHYFRKTGCVVTIHNAGLGYHQEVADLAFAQSMTGLPHRVIVNNLLDGAFDPLLAASPYATLNTVSENYARELRETFDDEQTGWLGHRLMARGLPLHGITNGIEPRDFDPSSHKEMGLSAPFNPTMIDEKDRIGKELCKKSLIETLSGQGFPGIQQSGFLTYSPQKPLFTFIGRLTSQKGVDKLITALKNLLPIEPDFQILILGSGEKDIEQQLVALSLARQFRGRICVLRGYDTQLATKVYAAGDFFLVPSQYEPCGLTDFMAQLFGNLPLVHAVGGLVKVRHKETGFSYQEHNAQALEECMTEAVDLYRKAPEAITAMQREAIKTITKRHTWKTVREQYVALYEKTVPSLTQ